MRNSTRLLIGLSMPGLALAAVWWWFMRRTRESSHGNGFQVPRDADQDMNDKWLGSGEECGQGNHGTATCFRHASEIASSHVSDSMDSKHKERDVPSDKSYSYTQENNGGQGSECSNITLTSNIEDMANAIPPVSKSHVSTEKNKRLESFDTSDTESAELSGNRMPHHAEATVEMTDLSKSFDENECDENTNSPIEDTALITAKPTNFSKSKNNDNTDSKDDSGSDTVSDKQKNENTSKLGTTSRTQSLDEYSDVSSGDGQSKTESPLDPKMMSTVGSDIENAQPGVGSDDDVTWELEFPQALCGRLIGKKGKNVQKISQITGTKIRLIPQKDNTESSQRLVSLTGSCKQLTLALKVLREKFPSVPFTRLNDSQPYDRTNQECLLTSSIVCVALPENELCQVFVTNIEDANHFYVQLNDHSIHSHLRQLDQQMSHCYGNTAGTMLLQAINTGMLCASLSPSGWWWRAQVVGLLMTPDEVEITWLDYGGRTTLPTAMLRQLRSDFMQLPFQAVECYLSNVVPNHGESTFSMAACALFEQLTQNVILTARVTSYTRDCPNIELYVSDQWTGQPIFVNRELVRRGYARWSET